MDRLAVIIPNGCNKEIVVLQRKDDGVPYYREWNASTDIALKAALRRLVAYERTGLTPEQVAELQTELAALRADIEAGRLVRVPCKPCNYDWRGPEGGRGMM